MSHQHGRRLFLEPLDVLFFRDGRPFGAATRAGGAFPTPQTLSGAIRTALLNRFGCDFGKLSEASRELSGAGATESVRMAEWFERGGAPGWIASIRVRGPWFARRRDLLSTAGRTTQIEILVPVPATLHTVKKGTDRRLRTLRPLRQRTLPGWASTDASTAGLVPLWTRDHARTEPAHGFLTELGLRQFLRGEHVNADELLAPATLLARDHRTGIAVDADRLTAADSMIYGASFLALRPAMGCQEWQIGFAADVELPAEAPADVLDDLDAMAFGGEGRRVLVHRCEACGNCAAQWPGSADSNSTGGTTGGRPFVLLTTPGLFADGWCPAALKPHLVAASVPGAIAVSGWDLARGGPRPNRFAAAPGSVYFLDNLPTGLEPCLSDEPLHRQQGWGCFVKGTWNDE